MKTYTLAERQRIIDMIEAFELCKKAPHTYICFRLAWLLVKRKISTAAYRDCKSLIRRALNNRPTLESWLCDRGYYSARAWPTRQQWLTKIIKDLRSYL